MGYAAGNRCYSTVLAAAQSACMHDYPRLEVLTDSTRVVISCASADVTGLSGSIGRLNLLTSSGDAAPTAFSIQSAYPECTGGTDGVALDATFWLVMVVLFAVGFIAGQQR